MFHPATYVFLVFVIVLFLVVRHLLRRWGLSVGGPDDRGDFGLGRLFAVVAYFVLWVVPCMLVWVVADITRQL